MRLPVSLIHVVRSARITPRMARIAFRADRLPDSVGRTPDEQVKLCFPRPGQNVPRLPGSDENEDTMRWYQAYLGIPEDERPLMRSYTLRTRHPGSNVIEIDFVLHDDAGPATRWARTARPGAVIGMVGPSAEYARPLPEADVLLLAGDETALPAIGTFAESLAEGARAVAYIEVADAGEEQRLRTRGRLSVHYVHRDGVPAGQGTALLQAVREARLPAGSTAAWLAGEAGTVRALRRHLVGDRGFDKRSIEFTGYWRLKLTQDDPPTPEDLAEARERIAGMQAAEGEGA